MEKKNVKSQIRSNFQTMSFEDAVKANEVLLPEYVEAYGQRSYNSLCAYYKKHHPYNIAAEPTSQFETDVEVPVEDTEFKESIEPVDTTEEELTEPNEVNVQKEDAKPFAFVNMEKFDKSEIETLLKSKDQILKKKCGIVITFEVAGDFNIRRSIQMFVGNNGKGWDNWNDVRAFLDSHDFKNEKKLCSFSDSNANFPVGTKIVKVWGEWIGFALQRFYLDRYTLDSESKVEYVQFVD